MLKIDPFAPVKVESFDLTTDDTPTPEFIESGIQNMKSLNTLSGAVVFKNEGKIQNNSIIVDNYVTDSGLQPDFDLARCRSLFSKTFKIEDINLDQALIGGEEKPVFTHSSFIGSEST